MSSFQSDSISTSSHDINSDRDLTAQTAQSTVMAEQVSHNVVNYPESASASLADVAANQTTAPSADDGTTTEYSLETKNNLDASQAANEYAVQANELASSMQTEPQTQSEADIDVIQPTLPAGGEVNIVPDPATYTPSAEYSQLVNGIQDDVSGINGVVEDEAMHEGSVDVSVNSDTEGSRGDASELKKDEKHHVRTNSVKKPTQFSKVSVTKNFLAKSATTTPAIAKPGEKPSPAGTPPQPSASKPRLIAKSGTQIRDLQKARLGTEPAGGPDASKVWNKNRPVPPPPPKQFTDEELKQQYGIHLATRLQTDENGKESKWADIDDDEEDWAPDTVVWMDGTKSTLAPNETAALVQKEQQPSAPQPVRPGDGVRQPILATKKKTELGPTKTILKPGASAAAAQARQNDSGAATPSEKAALTSKSSAAMPVKSPWAALPPVDKVPPINPPVQVKQTPQPFPSQDARSYEPSMPSAPAREIAADTFDRSWREGEGGTRELFNSANGRYEPVQEGGRRGSIKPDSAYRKPSLLQRPSPVTAPAEPSAAFQTRSTSQMDGQWTRRRGSSVSQGSIPSVRRMSTSKTSEISPAPERRTSTVIGHDMRNSPKMSRDETVVVPNFTQQSPWQQQLPPRPEDGEPAAEADDPVKVQDRVMREKRELAKKRREEEEARLEAEKRERLQARLAQLEGAGKSRREREAEAAAAAVAVKTPASETAPENPPSTASQTLPTEIAAQAASALEAQSLEAAPAPSFDRQLQEDLIPSPVPPKALAFDSLGLPTADSNARDQTRAHPSPRPNERAPFQQPGAAYKAPPSSYSSPGDRKQQPFMRSPLPNADGFAGWGPTAPNGNVWGSAGIGNGTFEGTNLFAPIATSQQSATLPPPPGMSRGTGSNRISPQSLASESRSPSLQQQSVAEPPRGFGPPGFESHANAFANQGRANGPSPAPGLGRQTHVPGPIAPPSRAQQQPQHPAARQDPVAAWNNAAQKLPNQYRSDAEAAEKRAREPVSNAPRDDTFKETFRQTSMDAGKLGAPRRYDKTEYTIHDVQGSRSVQSLSPVPPSSQTQPPGPFTTASPMQQDPRKATSENNVRIPDPSLNPAHGGTSGQLPPIGPPSSQQPSTSASQGRANVPSSTVLSVTGSKEPSPPPPETGLHPVNTGDSEHPLVRLPKTITVKLPPAAVQAQSPPTQQSNVVLPPKPVQNWAPGSARPLVMQEAWQARFNGLFNRTPISTETPPSPPKTPPKTQGPALAVTSSSRAVMDEASVATSATVSLPASKKITSVEGFTIDDSDDVVSRPTIEQMFIEELSLGFTPKIQLPKAAFHADAFDEPPAYNLLRMGSSSRDFPAVQSEPIFNLLEVHNKRPDGFYVSIPALKLTSRLAKRQHKASRKPSSNTHQHQERKPSGKFKAKSKDSNATSSVTSSATGNDSRKASYQKGQTPTPTQQSPAPTGVSTGDTKKSSWAKPPKAPPRSRGKGPATVKAS